MFICCTVPTIQIILEAKSSSKSRRQSFPTAKIKKIEEEVEDENSDQENIPLGKSAGIMTYKI